MDVSGPTPHTVVDTCATEFFEETNQSDYGAQEPPIMMLLENCAWCFYHVISRYGVKPNGEIENNVDETLGCNFNSEECSARNRHGYRASSDEQKAIELPHL